jgi:16S rRNA (cytosine967-C5)-methyltransferase
MGGLSSKKAAATAVSAHVAVLKGEPLRLSLSKSLAKNPGMGGNERRFAAEATRELSRHQRWLDRIAKELGHAPSDFHLEEDRAVLRYALWRRFRQGAAVEQVMREVGLPGPVRPRSVPDAVIEKAINAAPPKLPDEPALTHSFPGWLAEALGNDARVMEALNREPPLMLKVRPNGTRDEVRALLGEIVTEPIDGVPDGLLLAEEGRRIFESKAMKSGRLIVMDAGSQRIVQLCNVQPGQTVVDYCAGAGGKTIALADAVGERGRVLAWDKSQRRLNEAKERVKTLRIRHVSFPSQLRLDDADAVLVDAPCSGTGTLSREPDQKWKLNPGAVEELKKTQLEILDEVAAQVGPRTTITYATCSLLRAEDEEVVESFLETHPHFSLEAQLRVWPHESPGGGFFAARLTQARSSG